MSARLEGGAPKRHLNSYGTLLTVDEPREGKTSQSSSFSSETFALEPNDILSLRLFQPRSILVYTERP